ncbi:MAG: hypothetical protein ACXACA_06545 [Candidatus Ranarchaeia archaeon]|jgi:hypothetical protein
MPHKLHSTMLFELFLSQQESKLVVQGLALVDVVSSVNNQLVGNRELVDHGIDDKNQELSTVPEIDMVSVPEELDAYY